VVRSAQKRDVASLSTKREYFASRTAIAGAAREALLQLDPLWDELNTSIYLARALPS
jgi:hypothetical protein